jgi:hypothetical protein
MKNLIERVEKKLQSQECVSLEMAKKDISGSDSGFYWIYTKLPMKRFSDAATPSNQVHIDFSKMAKIHKALKSVITQSNKEYWCIYNGKGKQLKTRLAAGFTNTEGKTGKLALMRCFKEDDFRIKYITCQSDRSKHGIIEKYDAIQRDLERAWRLHYGWPFLCRT